MAASAAEHGRVTGFPVAAIMEVRTVADNPWIDESWEALGVTVGRAATHQGENPRRLVAGPNAARYLWTGPRVDFFPDEAESYYHNLTVDSPGCFVVTRPRKDGMPEPVAVTVSFDVAQAYQEGGETVHSVALPPELYRAGEAFVLAHFLPQQKKKRRLNNWKDEAHGRY